MKQAWIEGVGIFDSYDDVILLQLPGLGRPGTSTSGRVYYGRVSVSISSGTLIISDGPLLLTGSTLEVPASDITIDGNRVISNNWEFMMNDGNTIRELPGRAGWTIVRAVGSR